VVLSSEHSRIVLTFSMNFLLLLNKGETKCEEKILVMILRVLKPIARDLGKLAPTLC
jgi:hypothetical protein